MQIDFMELDGKLVDPKTLLEIEHKVNNKGYKVTGNVFHHIVLFEIYNGRPAFNEVDHKDGNTANNSITNLRDATRAENQRNRGKFKNSSSKYKGVHWSKSNKAWVAQLRHDGKTYYIGQFEDEYLAHLAWIAVAKEAQGDFFRQL